MLANVCVRYHPYNLRLVGDLLQHASHLLVPRNKLKFGIFQTLLFGVLLDKCTGGTKIVSRKAGKEVVCYL